MLLMLLWLCGCAPERWSWQFFVLLYLQIGGLCLATHALYARRNHIIDTIETFGYDLSFLPGFLSRDPWHPYPPGDSGSPVYDGSKLVGLYKIVPVNRDSLVTEKAEWRKERIRRLWMKFALLMPKRQRDSFVTGTLAEYISDYLEATDGKSPAHARKQIFQFTRRICRDVLDAYKNAFVDRLMEEAHSFLGRRR